MNCTACIAFPTSSHEWMAQLEGTTVGPFLTQDIALQVAVIEAMRLRRLDRATRVIVLARNGNVCAERCLCKRFLR